MIRERLRYDNGSAESLGMTLLWCITGASLVVALVAWRQARRAAQRLDDLTQRYWELRYQHGELRVQLQRLTGDPAAPAPPAAERPPADGFVPLASLKR
jgi:hypothetical protein